MTNQGKVERLFRRAATGAPCHRYKQRAEATGHALETGVKVERTLVTVSTCTRKDRGLRERTFSVFGGKTSREKYVEFGGCLLISSMMLAMFAVRVLNSGPIMVGSVMF